jgi:hypothetical protein
MLILGKFCLIALVFLALFFASARALDFTLNDANLGLPADSYVDSYSQNTNYGTSTTLKIRTGNNTSSSLSNVRAFLIFDMTKAPTNITILGANLSVYYISSLSNGRYRNISVYNTSNNWSEGAITWANQPAEGTLQDMKNQSSAVDTWLYYNVTDAVIPAYDSGSNVSIMMRDQTENFSLSKYNTIGGRTYVTQSQRPQLILTITDNANPQWTTGTNISNSSYMAGETTRYYLNITDNVGLDGYIFSIDNCTGTFVNNSFTDLSWHPTDVMAQATNHSNETVGCTMRWCVYFNDTSNNWNGSSCDSPWAFNTTNKLLNMTVSSSLTFNSNADGETDMKRGASTSFHANDSAKRGMDLRQAVSSTLSLQTVANRMQELHAQAFLSFILNEVAGRLMNVTTGKSQSPGSTGAFGEVSSRIQEIEVQAALSQKLSGLEKQIGGFPYYLIIYFLALMIFFMVFVTIYVGGKFNSLKKKRR